MRRRWSRSPAKATRPRATLTQAVQRVEVARGLSPYTSTQENAWLVLAARRCRRRRWRWISMGSPVKAAVYRSYKADAMAGKPVKLTNTGDAPVQAVVSVSGSPVTPEPGGVERLQDRAQLLHARRQARRRQPRPSRTTASPWC
jgi:uncharacterized protein YfaS (alpha-2-macroglobulin family)